MNSFVALTWHPDGVVEVCFDRPEKLNSLVHESFENLVAVASQLSDDPDVRAVVLHGAGRAFCAGLDISNFDANGGDTIAGGRLAARTHGMPIFISRR